MAGIFDWFKSNKQNRGLEQEFIKCAEEFNLSRTLWHAYMDTHIKKYGMPTIYVGSVNYKYDFEYDAMSTLMKISTLPVAECRKKIAEEIEFLNKWKFPGKFSIGLFTCAAKINICGEMFNMKSIKSYDVTNRGADVIYTIRINRVGFREISIPLRDERSNMEMRSLLDVCVSFSKDMFNVTYSNIGEINPIIDENLDKSIISFIGVSLAVPIKEFIYSINQLSDDKEEKGVKISTFNPDYSIIINECEGYTMNWHFATFGNKYVYDHYSANTEDFIGYTNLRKAYDTLVKYFISLFGQPTDVTDVPSNIRKNSIMKALREECFEIETSFENDDIYASVELEVYEDEKTKGYISLYVADKRLCNVNRRNVNVQL